MIYRVKRTKPLFILLLAIFSLNSWADSYHYRADVKGMVCAFCVYSVSKKIRQLPGVDADSVNVSLKNKSAEFSSSNPVSEQNLTSLFSQSGFKLSNLTVTQSAVKKSKKAKIARLDMKIDVFETDQFTTVLKAIGDIAVKTPSRLVVEAPAEQEETVLKALLMGRKEVVQVRFQANDAADLMHLQLFSLVN